MEFTKEIGSSIYDVADNLWSEGRKTFERLSRGDQEAVISAMDNFYPERETLDIGILNDLLWHDFNVVATYCYDLECEIDAELADIEQVIENLQDELDNMENELCNQFGDNFELYESDEYSELENKLLDEQAYLEELQDMKDNEDYEELAFRLNIW